MTDQNPHAPSSASPAPDYQGASGGHEQSKSQLGIKAGRGGAFAIGTQIIVVLIQLANIAVFSRVLAPADFGLVAISTSIIAFIALFRDMGCSAAIIQKERLDQDTLSGVYVFNIGVAAILMLIGIVCAPLAGAFFGDGRVTSLIMVSSGTILIAAVGAQHSALLRRNMQIIQDRWINLVAVAVASAISIALVLTTDIGYWALVANAWLIVLVQTGLLWAVSTWRPSRVGNWQGARDALKFGLPLTGTELVYFFNRRFDDILIGSRWGIVELGFYSRAYSVLMIPQTMVSGPASSAIVPALSRLQSDPEQWRDMLTNSVRIIALATFLLAAMLTVNARDIVRILLGPDWGQAAEIVSIFGISMFARSLMSANPWIFLSLGQTGRMLRWQLLTLPLFIAGMLLGLPYGALGVALGFSLVHLAVAVPSVFYAAHRSPVSATGLLRVTGPIAAAALAAVLISRGLDLRAMLGGSGLAASALSIMMTLVIYAVGVAIVVMLDGATRNAFQQSGQWIRQLLGKDTFEGQSE
ncbi:lipopolysaccharide biosynthesis protein [Altererythrobacter sp. ZODW24]|uniref:lipopolysaccharide biosynthesis protein n=1 Tax=Altererythrobacter sp. ZODW24 TaxID=2185142 RepID=UPI0013B36793|nr:lipopolysaccharide biosynthesis protein [Altererythrobacter sp. ZODW24]